MDLTCSQIQGEGSPGGSRARRRSRPDALGMRDNRGGPEARLLECGSRIRSIRELTLDLPVVSRARKRRRSGRGGSRQREAPGLPEPRDPLEDLFLAVGSCFPMSRPSTPARWSDPETRIVLTGIHCRRGATAPSELRSDKKSREHPETRHSRSGSGFFERPTRSRRSEQRAPARGARVTALNGRGCRSRGLRYVASKRPWTLYYHRHTSRWERYPLLGPSRRLADLLSEVSEDPICVFWG
jgi:Protein of unknown function (DUF3024)